MSQPRIPTIKQTTLPLGPGFTIYEKMIQVILIINSLSLGFKLANMAAIF